MFQVTGSSGTGVKLGAGRGSRARPVHERRPIRQPRHALAEDTTPSGAPLSLVQLELGALFRAH